MKKFLIFLSVICLIFGMTQGVGAYSLGLDDMLDGTGDVTAFTTSGTTGLESGNNYAGDKNDDGIIIALKKPFLGPSFFSTGGSGNSSSWGNHGGSANNITPWTDGSSLNPSIFSQDHENTPIVNPEPATMLLLGSGLIGLAGFRRKFRKK